MEPVITINKSIFTAKIYTDNYPMNPREDQDNIGIINLSTLKNYDLTDKENYLSITDLINDNSNKLIILPIYAYIHSSITISLSPFSCKWDSGLAGFIYCNPTDYVITRKDLKDILKAEIKTLNQYLIGDVYGIEIIDNDTKEELFSCYSYYGYNYAYTEAEDLLNQYITTTYKQKTFAFSGENNGNL